MKNKLLYWIPTGLFCAFITNGVVMYAMKPEMVQGIYESLSYPAYLMYLNGGAKLLGVIAILAPVSKILKEWAFAGLFYILVLGLIAHVMVADGQWAGAGIALVLWAGTYWAYKKR